MRKFDFILLAVAALALALTLGLIGAEIADRVSSQPAIPDHLTIHGQKWSVAVVPTMAGTYTGFTECDLHVILLLKRSPAKMADTLSHEAEHAMAPCVDGVPLNIVWTDGEEQDQNHPGNHAAIYYGARQWTQFIADNPQAVEYIRWARGKR